MMTGPQITFVFFLYLVYTIFVISITCYKICILNYKAIRKLFEYEIKLYLAQLINNNVMTINPNQKVAVISGSSSGIGLETSLALARNGFLTYATMRNLKKADSMNILADKERIPIRVIQLDVTDDKSVYDAIQTITSDAGRIDVLVNNAGYGLFGAFEDLSIGEIKDLYETNFFGLVRLTQAVIPTMRKQQSDRIVNLRSGAGIFGFPGGSAYVSSKFTVEGLSESISYELEPFGIKV